MNYLKLAYNMAVSNYILLEDFLDYSGLHQIERAADLANSGMALVPIKIWLADNSMKNER